MLYASPSHHRTEKIVKIVILLKNPPFTGSLLVPLCKEGQYFVTENLLDSVQSQTENQPNSNS